MSTGNPALGSSSFWGHGLGLCLSGVCPVFLLLCVCECRLAVELTASPFQLLSEMVPCRSRAESLSQLELVSSQPRHLWLGMEPRCMNMPADVPVLQAVRQLSDRSWEDTCCDIYDRF